MSSKFIPNADVDFLAMARNFSKVIASEPAQCGVDEDDAKQLSEAFAAFEAARAAATSATRSKLDTLAKNQSRDALEQIIRRLAQTIRASNKVDRSAKMALNLLPRESASGKSKPLPKLPPRLRFVRALHEASQSSPLHELRFYGHDSRTQARPEGAVRLELFVDLVPPDEPIPARPGANHGGRPWYLRSYTRSPILLTPPMARVPMRVVYWARWADSAGNVGPFSATAVAWIEGGTIHHLGVPKITMKNDAPLLEDARTAKVNQRDNHYAIAVIEAHYLSFAEPPVETETPALEAPVMRETKQLEAPSREAANAG